MVKSPKFVQNCQKFKDYLLSNYFFHTVDSSYLGPGGGVTFVWSTMLEHVFKVPLHSEDSETIIIWSHKRDAAATKRTLWRLMTVQPTSINLKSLKNVSCSSFFKRLPMTVFKSVKSILVNNICAHVCTLPHMCMRRNFGVVRKFQKKNMSYTHTMNHLKMCKKIKKISLKMKICISKMILGPFIKIEGHNFASPYSTCSWGKKD